jgi:hypothetical protein
MISMLLNSSGDYVEIPRSQQAKESASATVSIPMETMDAVCQRLKVVPDLIKLDIEGYEWEALLGGKEILSKYKPVLFLELHLDFLEQRKIPIQECIDLLFSYGYGLFDLKGHRLTAAQICNSLQPRAHIIACPAGGEIK